MHHRLDAPLTGIGRGEPSIVKKIEGDPKAPHIRCCPRAVTTLDLRGKVLYPTSGGCHVPKPTVEQRKTPLVKGEVPRIHMAVDQPISGVPTVYLKERTFYQGELGGRRRAELRKGRRVKSPTDIYSGSERTCLDQLPRMCQRIHQQSELPVLGISWGNDGIRKANNGEDPTLE
jgi:hypothetical protein